MKKSLLEMEKSDNLQDFYKEKWGWIPENLQKEWGHFNVFLLDNYIGENAQPVPYKRRDFYKITYFKGSAQIHYADKSLAVKKNALVFSNPQIPYEWEGLEGVEMGYFCIFNQEFFRQFGAIYDYPVFKIGGVHLFEISEEQAQSVMAIFKKMQQEIQSNYLYKYDILRTQVIDLIHFAMKMEASLENEIPQGNASHRITTLFTELLERQFPIENKAQKILRSASEFAERLNVHTNHLNRAVKEITGKTTSEIIGERIVQEAKILLKHTDLSISEIGHILGFNETTYFSNFFKKQTSQNPTHFRKK